MFGVHMVSGLIPIAGIENEKKSYGIDKLKIQNYKTNFLCMFSSLLDSAKVRLFQATDTYSRFERTRAVYITFRQSKEEKLCDETN
jgi:hypothetical protein